MPEWTEKFIFYTEINFRFLNVISFCGSNMPLTLKRHRTTSCSVLHGVSSVFRDITHCVKKKEMVHLFFPIPLLKRLIITFCSIFLFTSYYMLSPLLCETVDNTRGLLLVQSVVSVVRTQMLHLFSKVAV